MKVLIIQQKMIGDVLTTSILFECLKALYPEAELHYVINSHTYAVVENNPYIDKYHMVGDEQKSLLSLIKFAKRLRHEKYDTVIDVYSKLSSNIIALFSGAKIKISKYKWYSSYIYTHTLEEAKSARTNAGLAIENRLRLLEPLNINSTDIFKPKIYLTESELTRTKKFLETNGLDISKPLIMIGVLGSSPSKTYPNQYMADLIDQIALQDTNCQILFNYIPNQEQQAKTILDLCKSSTQSQVYFNVFGKSLREFLAITSYCKALIGNEGGATNMAKALNIPTFTIFSPWIKKEAWNMFDDGITSVSVHLEDYLPELFKNQTTKNLKMSFDELYHKFNPQLFINQLKTFLKRI